jgi:hypothetical protein
MVVPACHLTPDLPPNPNETKGNPMIKLKDSKEPMDRSSEEAKEREAMKRDEGEKNELSQPWKQEEQVSGARACGDVERRHAGMQ